MPPTFQSTTAEDRALLVLLAAERGPRLKAVPLDMTTIDKLRAAKYVSLVGGRYKLTAEGRERATAIAAGATRPGDGPRRNSCRLQA